MQTSMFCFGKFHFLLVVGNMMEQKRFSIPDLVYWVDNITPPILADIEIFLHSIPIAKQFTGY